MGEPGTQDRKFRPIGGDKAPDTDELATEVPAAVESEAGDDRPAWQQTLEAAKARKPELQAAKDALRQALRECASDKYPGLVAQVQELAGYGAAAKFLDNEGGVRDEMALRTPAVLFRELGNSDLCGLSEVEVDGKNLGDLLNAAVDQCTAAMKILDTEFATRDLYDTGYPKSIDGTGPFESLQMALNTGKFRSEHQQQIGEAIVAITEATAAIWNHGVSEGWREMTNEDRTGYYAGNVVAA